ncbi:MAG: cytochrome P450 [Acidimicrobiales bacterium]|nr:cytochrome P450 [Acidimicrobiales bacterium]
MSVAVIGPKPGGPVKLLDAPPITADPPSHAEFRQLLLAAFSPKVIGRLTGWTTEVAQGLVAEIRASGDTTIGAAERRYARHIPVRVIVSVLGIPAEHEEQFAAWTVRILRTDPRLLPLPRSRRTRPYRSARRHHHHAHERGTERRAGAGPPRRSRLIPAAHRRDRHDLELHRCGARPLRRPPRRPPAAPHRTGAAARRHRGAPAVLRTDHPSLHHVRDAELGGTTIHAGDRVLLPLPAANRDPEVFEYPETFQIDRAENRHLAFGSASIAASARTSPAWNCG